MKKKTRYVSLIEILVVVAIIGILASLLLPSLKTARKQAKSASCLNNLRQFGVYTSLHLDDHDGNIPSRLITYDASHPDRNMGFNNARWHQFLGEYMSYNGNDHLVAPIFSCPDQTIFTHMTTGEKITKSLAYYVNPYPDSSGRSPWIDNVNVSEATEDYVNISEILKPAVLASIYDTAQGWEGVTPHSGAGGFTSAAEGEGVIDNPSPQPAANADPELLMGYKAIPAQGGTYYTRGAIDFRHPRQSANTVHFDGSATRLLNGGVKNKNMVNQ
ncbi:type II secretion system protein [Lentisphaera marina]|uniref:type II secretion system protein n=1 Tax=Lentisphaera marina TaxID=1111041 RepID=UPI002366BBC3|nr:type II secretion system protein [Lentisphaera marina]MDD7986027.1 type II secretion system protein [Lentisphaera marina]